MNKERNFIKSFFQFSIGQWIAALISFVTTPITTWLIIPEEFGKASMFTLAFNLLLNIALLGADQGFVRMFYEKEENKRKNLLWNALLPSLSVGIIIFIIIGVFWKELSFVLFGNDKEMKEIIEGLLKELEVDYITENNLQNIDNSQIILFWDIDDKEKLNEFNCEFLLGEL